MEIYDQSPLHSHNVEKADNSCSVITMNTSFPKNNITDMFVSLIKEMKKYRVNMAYKKSSNSKILNYEWANDYLAGFLFVSYLVVVLLYNYQNIILHSLGFLMFFIFVFNLMRRRMPVMQQYPNDDELLCEQAGIIAYKDEERNFSFVEDKYRFVDKFHQYKADLELWMQEQKPYLNKDFKLLDVMQVLPLNRSYISRLFNEGYGESFFSFVMRYRIDESVNLLENSPEMNIRQISDICGFSSPSVYGRAFLKIKGVTPNQYRKDFNFEFDQRKVRV